MRITLRPSLPPVRGALSVAAAAIAVGLCAPPAADAARREPCIPGTGGPVCHVWTGKATYVSDGDTIDVRVGRRRQRIRFTGIQTMELRRPSRVPSRRRGDCHALAATARLSQLLRRGRNRVRLAAIDPGAIAPPGRRYWRAVSTRIGGRWVDLGRTLLAEGHGLWFPHRQEWAWNRSYGEAAEAAALRGRHLWDDDRCGAGPAPDARLRLWINWDAEGDDYDNVNGEWVRIKNLDRSRDVSLAGWWFRDSTLPAYRFPSWARIPAGGTVTLYMGTGGDSPGVFHWGMDRPPFQNPNGPPEEVAFGDGGYLFDPHGDLRAWMTYPCRTTCTTGLRGAVELTAQARSPESVTVRNASASTVDLEGHRLVDDPYSYDFGPGSEVAPGESLVVRVAGSRGTDTRLERHWGLRRSILDDARDRVTLETFAGEALGCVSWGGPAC